MPINLSKGQRINLSKNSPINLEKKNDLDYLHVGLGWDVNERAGASFDLDAKVACQRNDGTWCAKYACNFSHKDTPNGAIHHCGDNLTGEGEGDDEVIEIRLSKLPEEIVLVEFFVDIYQGAARKQHFGLVENAFIRLVDMNSKKEICKFTLGPEYNKCTAVLMGTAQRSESGEWEFVAEGIRGTTRRTEAAGWQFFAKQGGERVNPPPRASGTENSSLLSKPPQERETCSCTML